MLSNPPHVTTRSGLGATPAPTGHKRPWWHWVIAVDALLIAATSVNRYLPELGHNPLFSGGGGWRLLEPLNLVREGNPATWWSGLALLVGGLLACELVGRQPSTAPPASRRAWVAVAAVLIALSADELGSFHERVDLPGGFRGVAAVAAIAFAWPLLVLFRQQESRSAAIGITLGFGLFGGVAVMEHFERATSLPTWLHGPRAGLEEGLELAAQLLIVTVLVRQRTRQPNVSWRVVVPRPDRCPLLAQWLTAALVLHVAVALWFVPTLTDLGPRGDPSWWFPCLAFALAAWRVWWANIECPTWRSHLVVAALMFASMDSVSQLSQHLLIMDSTLAAGPFSGACQVGLSATLFVVAACKLGAGTSTSLPTWMGCMISLVAVSVLAFSHVADVDVAPAEAIVAGCAAWLLWASGPKEDGAAAH